VVLFTCDYQEKDSLPKLWEMEDAAAFPLYTMMLRWSSRIMD
jgi:hypothetical protein